MRLIISISPRRITQVLALVVLCLSLANITGQFYKYVLGHDHLLGLVRRFDFDEEGNIPTWYSSSTLLLCSILLATIASAKKINGERYAFHWIALSSIFLCMSLDETASFHEKTIKPLRSALHASGFLYQAWVIPGAAFVLVFVLAYLRFLAYLPVKTRLQFLIAGTLYAGGALGMELVTGAYLDLYGKENITYAMLTTIEESLEMLGVLVFIYALMSYMSSHLKDLVVRVNDEEPSAGSP